VDRTPSRPARGRAFGRNSAQQRRLGLWRRTRHRDRSGDTIPAVPGKAPREKGIDVLLAIDLAMMAVQGEFDVGILVSADTDLIPALDAVYDFNGPGRPWIEVAGWRGPFDQKRIAATPPRRIGGLWIEQADYDLMCDRTDYNISKK
jgi:hypothetical protein